MKVIYRLAGRGAAVGHEAVAAPGDPLISGNLSRCSHKMSDDPVVFGNEMINRWHMLARN